ncbi:ORF46h [Corchorus olitorius]|uniref:ORF46h n=1 Tax=Corchorus olitorius TaxID=93759 RepID=A0A1R3KZ67_9ROSI|nr:ORF46h [Corchorus olitorius]
MRFIFAWTFAPRNIAIPTPSRQSHEPLIHDHGGGARQNRKTHIGFRDNQARTDDFHHVKVTLYR